MSRRIFIAGNWKMHMEPGDAQALAREVRKTAMDHGAVEVAVAPPFLSIPEVVQQLQHSGVGVAAQNMHWEKKGAYTGEVSAGMIRKIGCTHVIIGHSERRQYFGETDITVNRKVHAALSSNLRPILCIGETASQRDEGQATAVVEGQLAGGLAGLDATSMADITLAYEPIWAIGTGRTATPEQAQAMHEAIRNWLSSNFGAGVARSVRIQYGGSVKPSNAKLLLSRPDIDGALVGGASLNAPQFAAIIEAACY